MPDSLYQSFPVEELTQLPRRARQNAVRSEIPHFLHKVSAGFPSPASDYIEDGLDLNTYIVRNKAACYFFTVEGESMRNAGIFPGDVLAVDRATIAKHNDIIVAVVNNEYTVKRLYRKDGIVELRPENPAYKTIRITEDHDLVSFGVVIGVIRRIRN